LELQENEAVCELLEELAENASIVSFSEPVMSFELDLAAILTPILQDTLEMLIAVLWQVAPYMFLIAGAYLALELGLRAFMLIEGTRQVIRVRDDYAEHEEGVREYDDYVGNKGEDRGVNW
jgi:hypothetical protein